MKQYKIISVVGTRPQLIKAACVTNEINKYNQDTWIGISHYRRLWLKENHERSISLINLNRNLLSNISEENLNFDAFIPNPQNLTGYKLMKLLKTPYEVEALLPFDSHIEKRNESLWLRVIFKK